MTNAIEQAKREMYGYLAKLQHCVRHKYVPYVSLPDFEASLEFYLEQVRQDHEALHETARKRFEDVQALEAANDKLSKALRYTNETIQRCAAKSLETIRDLESRLAKMTEDRDGCQSRMQAIDHAYNEQQRKTGTCGQACGDRGASEQPDAKTMALLGVIVDCQQLVSDWAVYGYRAKRQMKKMAYVLNNNPELRAALDHFEGKA